MKVAPLVIACLAAVVASGCIPSQPLAEGELDAAWSLSENVADAAEYVQPAIAGRRFPAKWTIYQHPSVIWSTVTIVRALDELETQPKEISFAVSPVHAEAMVSLLDKAGEMLAGLAKLTDASRSGHSERWAETMAKTLVQVEQIARMVSLDDPAEMGEMGEDPTGLAAGPLLKMLALYINENADGSLLGDLTAEDVGRLRTVLTQLALKVGFDLAGRQLPPDLRAGLVSVMRQADRMDTLQLALDELLADAVGKAPPSVGEGKTAKLARMISSWGPQSIHFFQQLIGQWDKIDNVELGLRRLGGRSVLTVDIHVLPGKEVRVAKAIILQPTLVFRGGTRIVLMPESPETDQTIVTFDPIGEGAVEIRFEGMAYSMARLFAFPLSSGAVREVRVFTHVPKRGDSVINAVVLMEATDTTKDPRRVLVFHDVRRRQLVRTAFAVQPVTVRTEQAFSYLNARRRWTYRRIKELAGH